MVERFDYDHTMSETLNKYPDGQFALYSDYAALEGKLAELRDIAREAGNQIHNLSCRHQYNEDLASALQDLRSRLWKATGILSALEATPPANREDSDV